MSAPHYAEGGYVGKVTQQALVKAQTGNSQMVIRFTVEKFWNKEKNQEEVVVDKQERPVYRTITENTAKYAKQDMNALGFTGTWKEQIRQVDPSSPNYKSIIGREIKVFCTYELDSEQNPREKWGISQFAAEPVTNYEALDAMFEDEPTPKPKAAEKSAGTTPAGKPNGTASTEALTDDELAGHVAEVTRSKGNTLKKSALGVNLLTLKLGRDSIKRAQEESFLKQYDGVLWKFDGSSIVME